jgi:hypothetical protein
MSKYEDASTNLISLGLEMMDIGEKLGKMKTADMDAMIATGFSDSKRINTTLKKILGLEEMVATLRQSISKASLKAMVAEDPVETKKEKALTVAFRALELRPKVEPTKKAPSKEEPKVEEVKPESKTKKDTKVKKDTKAKVESESDDESLGAASSDTKPLHVRRKKIPKHIRTLVWNEHIGSSVSENLCCCCKKEKIDVRNFHCGHVIADANGGDLTIPNLRPICPPCNSAMGTRSMNEFMKEFFGRTL